MIVAASERTGVSVLIKGPLQAQVMHDIAEALVLTHDDIFSDVIRSHFAAEIDEPLRWYCLDFAEAICRITFSARPRPRFLSYRGTAAQIAAQDAAPLVIRVQAVDSIRPSRAKDRPRPAFLTEDVLK